MFVLNNNNAKQQHNNTTPTTTTTKHTICSLCKLNLVLEFCIDFYYDNLYFEYFAGEGLCGPIPTQNIRGRGGSVVVGLRVIGEGSLRMRWFALRPASRPVRLRSARSMSTALRLLDKLWRPPKGQHHHWEAGFSKSNVAPMALRIGLLRSLALQNDGHIKPVILQCPTPQETNPKGRWGPNHFFIIRLLCSLPPCTQSWYTQSYGL